MPDRTCSVDGCERKPLAKGLCKAHYERQRRNGTPGGAVGPPRFYRPVPACSVEGCDRPHKTNGYCGMHYQRWRKWGDASICKPRAQFGAEHPCWKGDAVGYLGAHHRVERAKGRADSHRCVDCGEPAAAWSYDHLDPNERHGGKGKWPYSTSPDHYQPRCHGCHNRFDRRVLEDRRAT